MQGLGPYSTSIKKAEKEIKEMAKKVNDLCGMCEIAVLSLSLSNPNRNIWYNCIHLLKSCWKFFWLRLP